MERICFLFQNHQKEPDNPSVATQAQCSCSLLVSSSSTSQSVSNIIRGFIPLFHLHHYCFCFFFSNPISHTSNLSQKQTLAHTHMYVLSWLQIHITTLKGTCTEQILAHTLAHALRECSPEAGASVAAWCSISRTAHNYSSKLRLESCNVLSIPLNQLYLPPKAKRFTNALLLWTNELWMNPLHDVFFYSRCFFIYLFYKTAPAYFLLQQTSPLRCHQTLCHHM